MRIKAYKNYGVLGNEKRVVCTVDAPGATALTYDEIEIEIPENFSVSVNAMGSTLIDNPDGKTYLVLLKSRLIAGFFPVTFRDDGIDITIESYRGTLTKEVLGDIGDGYYWYRSASVDIIQR